MISRNYCVFKRWWMRKLARWTCPSLASSIWADRAGEKDQALHPRPRLNLFCFSRRAMVTGACPRAFLLEFFTDDPLSYRLTSSNHRACNQTRVDTNIFPACASDTIMLLMSNEDGLCFSLPEENQNLLFFSLYKESESCKSVVRVINYVALFSLSL